MKIDEDRLIQMAFRGCGGRRMRYPASEKLEIIRLVEESTLPVRRTLEKIGMRRRIFYRPWPLSNSILRQLR
jgi:putative transposase